MDDEHRRLDSKRCEDLVGLAQDPEQWRIMTAHRLDDDDDDADEPIYRIN